MGGGAWPFLVGGAICLVNSDNERDSSLLNSAADTSVAPYFLEGQAASSHTKLSNNRSVMPLDVRGRTRATLKESACSYPGPKGLGNPLKLLRDWDRDLQLFPLNEEFLVSASHQLALITSLPFVHTARRYYRLNDLARVFGLMPELASTVASVLEKSIKSQWFRGSKSRNKVSVGEPAEGSLSNLA